MPEGVICDGCDIRRGNTTAACRRCSTVAPLSRGLCPRCRLHDRVRQLRDAGQPAAVSALDPFLTALAAAPIAASTLRWLQSPAHHVVIALLDGRVPVTHAGLDAAAASRNHVGFLRAHLVSCGVLEERDEHSASFARWHQQAVLQIAPGADRAHVQAFARWQIAHDLARARRL